MTLGKFIIRCLVVWLLGICSVLASIGIGRSYSFLGMAGPVISIQVMFGCYLAIGGIIFHGLGIPRGRRTVAAWTGIVGAICAVVLSAAVMRDASLSDPFAWVMILLSNFVLVFITVVYVGPRSFSNA